MLPRARFVNNSLRVPVSIGYALKTPVIVPGFSVFLHYGDRVLTRCSVSPLVSEKL